ncbi:MAG: hypothetical protein MI974_07060 [Chitinophagales bacterium]|nr:hypothetical protein [Chitinophagales bacterium]
MNDLTVAEIVNFFSHLDLKKKIEVLNKLTNILNKGMREEAIREKATNEENETTIIDELFGSWLDEGELREDTIIDRTISDREININ